MSDKRSLEVKGVMDFDSLATFLGDLVCGFQQRSVCIQRGDESLTLTPSNSIDVEIEASVKKDKQKLEIELSWREDSGAKRVQDLNISAAHQPLAGTSGASALDVDDFEEEEEIRDVEGCEALLGQPSSDAPWVSPEEDEFLPAEDDCLVSAEEESIQTEGESIQAEEQQSESTSGKKPRGSSKKRN